MYMNSWIHMYSYSSFWGLLFYFSIKLKIIILNQRFTHNLYRSCHKAVTDDNRKSISFPWSHLAYEQILCPSFFCEIWALYLSWITYDASEKGKCRKVMQSMVCYFCPVITKQYEQPWWEMSVDIYIYIYIYIYI